jgi:hypothetical protein
MSCHKKCSNLKNFYDLHTESRLKLLPALCCILVVASHSYKRKLCRWTNKDRAHPDEIQEYKYTLIEHTYQMNINIQVCKNSYSSAVGKGKILSCDPRTLVPKNQNYR